MSGATDPVRVGVLTVSDAGARGERDDRSGRLVREWCAERGYPVRRSAVVADDTEAIVRELTAWADGGEVDAVLTTGGTGFGPRDVTPEATRSVLDREAPGIAEAFRRAGVQETPYAVLSRGLAGSRGAVFIANFPGSPGGVRDGLAVLDPLLEHVVELLRGAAPSHEPEPGGGP